LLFKYMLIIAGDFKSHAGAAVNKCALCLLVVLTLLASTAVSCTREAPAVQNEVETTLSLSSTAFKEGDRIPIKYTCDEQDISPPLAWNEPPQKTQTYALIVDDPDAPSGIFTHWILFNLPANVCQISEGIPPQMQLQDGTIQGKNDFGRTGYSGPCPPSGPAHRYRFILYALDNKLDLNSSATKEQLLNAIRGHIIAESQLIGTYQR
jgi:Raf kinase inhibitor-like YbhB/YbcL family protein